MDSKTLAVHDQVRCALDGISGKPSIAEVVIDPKFNGRVVDRVDISAYVQVKSIRSRAI